MTHHDDVPDAAAEERESTPNASGPEGAAGGMGSAANGSATQGLDRWVGRPPGSTSAAYSMPMAPPEQSRGGEEPQPDGLEPKAGYPSLDPRHEDKPDKG